MKNLPREASLVLVLGLLLGLLAAAAPSFFEPQPLLSRLSMEAPCLVATCGMVLVMLVRQIDISIGSQFALCGVLAGTLAAKNIPLPFLAPAVLATGALLGAFNGWLVAFLRLPSIVVTLATMVILRETVRWSQQGALLNLPPQLQWLGLPQSTGQWLLITTALALTAALAWGLKNLRAGRCIYAVGSDPEAARLAGIPPATTTAATFLLCGLLSATAALMNLVQSPQVDPKSGTGLELKTVAAAVVGGIAISGGRGRLWGAALGLLLLGTVSPALTHLHVEAYWEKAVQGAVILLAVILDRSTPAAR